MIFVDHKDLDFQNYIFTNSLTELKNFFLTALVILCACSTDTSPDDLIEKDKMVKVMIEIHLLESKVNNVRINPIDSTQAVYNHYENLLFKDLEITQEQYERSFNYYVDNPNEFEKIYNAVVDSLMERENRHK